jgi:transcriptional regulator CtsR
VWRFPLVSADQENVASVVRLTDEYSYEFGSRAGGQGTIEIDRYLMKQNRQPVAKPQVKVSLWHVAWSELS